MSALPRPQHSQPPENPEIPQSTHREKLPISPEHYLALDRAASERSEFVDGQIFSMAGGSGRHSQISLNLAARLHSHLLTRQCRVYQENMRTRISPRGNYTYPDVVAVCPPFEFEGEDEDILTNPVLIAEVLSDSTESHDRGFKFQHYQQIPTLQEYLLVSQKSMQVEKFTRHPSGPGWDYRIWSLPEDEVPLLSLDLSVRLAEIYAKVRFPQSSPLKVED